MFSPRDYILSLSLCLRDNLPKLYDLLNFFPSPQACWEAEPREFETLNFKTSSLEQFLQARQNFNLQAAQTALQAKAIKYLTQLDADYPDRLKEIFAPPWIFYYLGDFRPEDQLALAIVGSRKASGYGITVSRKLGMEAARLGLTIVSGMARGVDTAAHKGALEAGGRTIAVLGCGVDRVYPPENKALQAQIARQGVVLSEWPPGTPPLAWHFPVRNRIISALALGVVITEAGANSGALITAREALEQGKEVFAVPGNILDPTYKGAHQLIKDGAKLAGGIEDILEELKLPLQALRTARLEPRPQTPEDSFEVKLLDLMGYEGKNIDQLMAGSGLDLSGLSARLLELEMRGLIQRRPGNLYVRIV